MQDAGEAGGRPVLLEQGEHVFGGVGCAVPGFGGGGGELGGAAMQEDGFAGGGGDLHLGAEGGLLGGDVGVVEVVVVEADLADGDAAWVSGELGRLARASGVAWWASCGWMPALAQTVGCW